MCLIYKASSTESFLNSPRSSKSKHSLSLIYMEENVSFTSINLKLKSGRQVSLLSRKFKIKIRISSLIFIIGNLTKQIDFSSEIPEQSSKFEKQA